MRFQIDLPEGLKISNFKLSMLFAVKLFEEGLISSGQGAEMVGLSQQAFIELLGKYKVSVFQYNMKEIEADIADKATEEMDRLWEEQHWSDETMEAWAQEHLRTKSKD